MKCTQPFEVFLRPKWARVPGDFVGTVWAVSAHAAAYQWRKHRAAPSGHTFAFRKAKVLL